MIRAARKHTIKLMIAYRLHFEEANLKAVQLVKSGKIGEPRFFNSLFSLQVKEGNIRTRDDLGGGTLYDLGVYSVKNREPEPSGSEGLADVRVIEALYRSARIGKPVKLSVEPRKKRPMLKQEIHRPPVGKAKLIHVESASA